MSGKKNILSKSILSFPFLKMATRKILKGIFLLAGAGLIWTFSNPQASNRFFFPVIKRQKYAFNKSINRSNQGKVHTDIHMHTVQRVESTKVFMVFSRGVCVCVCTCACRHARGQMCPTLCDAMDCSLPGSSVHGILLARILEWVSIPSSRGSSWPRDLTLVSYVSWIGSQILYHWARTWVNIKMSFNLNSKVSSIQCHSLSRLPKIAP